MDRPASTLEDTPKAPRPPEAPREGVWYPRWYWPSFAAPAIVWLILLFLLPFYVTISITFGTKDLFQNPQPEWVPWRWPQNTLTFQAVVGKILGTFGEEPLFQAAFLRTILYVIAASIICVLIAYPVAYYVARFGGRRKTLFLTLLIAPFWVSYLMRMLAWTNLLQADGYVNKLLVGVGLLSEPYEWLEGKDITVIMGLVYGYVPYMILPLYAGLDRINQSLLEASRDLGAGPARTFLKVTLPLSRPALLAGIVIIALPMFGDYYTTYLLSSRGSTAMIGTLIDDKVHLPGGHADAAGLVLILMMMLIPLMLYYLWSSRREVAT